MRDGNRRSAFEAGLVLSEQKVSFIAEDEGTCRCFPLDGHTIRK